MTFKNLSYSIPWNLFLITIGSVVAAAGINAVIIPHGLITGGFSGLGILLLYATGHLTTGVWFLLLNIPVFLLGYKFISKRFLGYSTYGMIILSIALEVADIPFRVRDPWLAALAGGIMVGAGTGFVFRSLGSSGGNDIISILLNQKWGIRIGTYNFAFNFVLFFFSFGKLETDLVLYSMAAAYITAQVTEYCITLFNQRKMIIVISDKNREIAHEITHRLKRGATFLKGQGAYTGNAKDILLTVANTYQIKRMEEIVFNIDPRAFMITENTFNVLGEGFSKRKVY